jgi:hypothetical protein
VGLRGPSLEDMDGPEEEFLDAEALREMNTWERVNRR